ncbi:hypothetical protein Bca4012_026184 [Brassica carinata]
MWFIFLFQMEHVAWEEKTVGGCELFGTYCIILDVQRCSYTLTFIFNHLIVVKVIRFRLCITCYLIYYEIGVNNCNSC